MKCTICGEEVTLIPSAQQRAEKYGETAQFYTKLFPQHTHCLLAKHKQDTLALIKRIRNEADLRIRIQ